LGHLVSLRDVTKIPTVASPSLAQADLRPSSSTQEKKTWWEWFAPGTVSPPSSSRN